MFSIVALALLPLMLNTSAKRFILNSNFLSARAVFFSFFIANSILLGWIGGQPIEEPMYTVGQYATGYYFFLLFIVFPLLNGLLANEL
jgi:ubiquinol-cytochrome c reductase cytochrome b subunit